MWFLAWLETGLVPDALTRLAIRAVLRAGSFARYREPFAVRAEARRELRARLRRSPIALHPQDPNRQHYEVPAEFFELILGPRLKYSCGYWPPGVHTLAQSEEAMLALTCERARVADGMEVLDLGCGWGALALWIAERYPHAQVTAVSNSRTQQEFIERRAAERGLAVRTLTAEVNDLPALGPFDRILSVEMFEHCKNYARLLARLAAMLRPEGRLFVHHFSHRELAYEFDAGRSGDWMAQTFFSGGTMPSDDLLLYFQDDLRVLDHWVVGGEHYARTLEAWRKEMDRRRGEVRRVLAQAYGADQVARGCVNWRLFFMVCQETWGYAGGSEYVVSHYLLAPRDGPKNASDRARDFV